MFNIFKTTKKIISWQTNKSPKKEQERREKAGVQNNSLNKATDKISDFFDNIYQTLISEHGMIREKMKNLYQSNYDLGLKHLKKGNVKEAIFRFRIIKKFWPNQYDAYYQLIYCLMLNKNFLEAQKIIDELLTKNPNDKERINKLLSRR